MDEKEPQNRQTSEEKAAELSAKIDRLMRFGQGLRQEQMEVHTKEVAALVQDLTSIAHEEGRNEVIRSVKDPVMSILEKASDLSGEIESARKAAETALQFSTELREAPQQT